MLNNVSGFMIQNFLMKKNELDPVVLPISLNEKIEVREGDFVGGVFELVVDGDEIDLKDVTNAL